MTEAVLPVMDYAFNNIALDKMILAYALGNDRSRGIKEKTLGRFIGTKPFKFFGSQYSESELWEVTKEEWNSPFTAIISSHNKNKIFYGYY